MHCWTDGLSTCRARCECFESILTRSLQSSKCTKCCHLMARQLIHHVKRALSKNRHLLTLTVMVCCNRTRRRTQGGVRNQAAILISGRYCCNQRVPCRDSPKHCHELTLWKSTTRDFDYSQHKRLHLVSLNSVIHGPVHTIYSQSASNQSRCILVALI